MKICVFFGRYLLVAPCLQLISIQASHAGCFENQNNQAFFELGVAQTQSAIKVHHASGEPSPEPIGLIESNYYYNVHLAAGSPYQYFELIDGKAGYYCRAGIGNFELRDQPNFNDSREQGDKVRGYYVFAHPVIFLHFGDRSIKPGNMSAKVGVGLGIGYLKAKGDMLIDNHGSIENSHVNLNGLGLTYETFVEGRVGNWFSRLVYFGPEVEDKDFTYTFVGSSLQVGYTVTF